ncbi:DNA-3-methyladenine glycosylase 2 [Aestuariimicrobium kwangyangense]|uniref:DNA-3-methyladenine glycosylase 2 n=1 Tax=Aestuariimicrobium kwangyangense TaxID=396389 RepID=UPI0003B2F58E|nr:AlkA N-terminal domain-containing protein [Aestuariimicrobium kwangyangense]
MTSALLTGRVPANGAFDRHAALGTLAAHSVAGVDRVDLADGSFTRLHRVGGRWRPLRVILDDGGATWVLGADQSGADGSGDAADAPSRPDENRWAQEITSRVADWFDLAADLGTIDGALGAHPVFREQVRDRPGIRVTRFADPWQATCMTVVGQQVSLAAARLFTGRLVQRYSPEVRGGDLRPFPDPAVIAEAPVEQVHETVGLTGARARTVRAVAELFAAAAGAVPSRGQLGAVTGVGPWTLDYLAIRVGHEVNAFPASDAVLRRLLMAEGFTDERGRFDAASASAQWHPWRSYAACRLWASAHPRPEVPAPRGRPNPAGTSLSEPGSSR